MAAAGLNPNLGMQREPKAGPIVRKSADLVLAAGCYQQGEYHMNSIIYIVGLIVIVLFILSFLGLR
jgi:hypothetical protein